ncbi:MAG: LLM class flavin-dependent oxidoreductase [Pseudomonadota bacterium]
MSKGKFKKVEVLRGPFDPGGQPDTRTGQPMELGFFAWNIKGGMTVSKGVMSNPERYQDFWHWDNAARMVQLAEQIGFDYQVPFARWIGQGGETNFNDSSLDFLTSAAATAPLTSKLALFSTAHVTFQFHPLHFAKFGATIDFISKGRWGLNIVTGYSAVEQAAFGIDPPVGHDESYDMADEFTTLMKYLWTEDEPIEFEGQYYQSYGGFVSPKPVSNPRPVIMNAGNSEIGVDFACRQADWVFVTAPTIEAYKERIELINRKASQYKREVRVATMVYVIQDSTDEKAFATKRWLEEEVDREATLNFIQGLKRTAYATEFFEEEQDDGFGGVGEEMFLRIAVGFGAWQMIGSFETVAEQIRELHEIGIESILMCFFDPLGGLHHMEDHIMPIMKKMGLRK